ncbi:hypothetical protein AU210_012210 [Fusarium oxysporum f. sp. radicis-cucumerinum]|uniref:Uncharacterized protein n=1 Tax=Fusarium oxysporum f. sp. radicis-cucumerinum TaxID=327505 RepID=A0A2H3GG76_FUSOX|nr:hypothetical protein AU210_012210 [Fusarium oxysporum f. sp. radicis-cucumerinum]
MIFRHERVIAIFGNDDSTSFGGSTRPFPFPQLGYSITKVDGFHLCRHPTCGHCASSPEFVPIHHDCYSIFIRDSRIDEADAVRWLWLRSAWRKPWRGAQPLFLAVRRPDSSTVQRMADIVGLPELSRLPNELFEIIRGFSPHSIFWKSLLAIQLASYATRMLTESLSTVLLSEVLSWERHGVLKCTSSLSRSPIIRLTIDFEGINKVERLPVAPAYSGKYSNYNRTIIEHESLLNRVQAQVKGGLLRLKMPQPRQSLPIWNTPSPPKLQSCNAYISRFPAWQHFHAIDTDRIDGITFFFSGGQLFGTHIHTSKESSAITTFERFSKRRQRSLVWIYFPIAESDQLIVLGIRQGPHSELNILVRTRQVGDVIIGKRIAGQVTDRCLCRSAPVTIVYGEPEGGLPVQLFGAYSRTSPQLALPSPFPLKNTSPDPLGKDSYFSWASLDNIASTLTFHDGDGFCRGIMFQYQDGGCRAVGQCRLHVDSAVKEIYPAAILFSIKSIASRWDRKIYTVQVEFRHCLQPQIKDGWECMQLKGSIKFWFTDKSSYLVIE